MEIFRIAALALITAFCVLVLREAKSDLSYAVLLAGGICVLLSVIDYFSDIFSVVNAIAKRAGLAAGVVKALFKVIAIGYITEFASSIIEDMGMNSLSEKVTLAGKIVIVCTSLPIVVDLFEFVAGLLS